MTKKEIKELDNSCEVCVCMNISLGEIRTAIEDGDNTIDKLMESTDAGTACEQCQTIELDKDEDKELHLDEILDSIKS